MLTFFSAPEFVVTALAKITNRETIVYFIWPLAQIIIVVSAVAFWALYATYFERKISAFMQARLGPMRVGPWGLLQPFADAIKLLTKEDLQPDRADSLLFHCAPYIAVAATFIVFAVIPFAPDWGVIADVNIGILFVISISSVSVLALILAGWSSNSKYALLGALRSSAQLVSYEVALGLSLIGALMLARTLSVSGIVAAQGAESVWFVFYQPLGFIVFLISGIAENNRAPFDLPEAESELVAGFHTEYSGMRWSLFFMAEYAGMVVIAAMATSLFLGGWYFWGVHRLTEAHHLATIAGGRAQGAPLYHALYIALSLLVFLIKMAFLMYVYFWLRWTLPRYRYDQLMDLGWRWMIPAALGNIVWTAFSIFLLQWLSTANYVQTIAASVDGGAGLHLTIAGKFIMIALGCGGVLTTAIMLSIINRGSRDFNLKKQRRQVRLVDVPQGKPAVTITELEKAG